MKKHNVRKITDSKFPSKITVGDYTSTKTPALKFKTKNTQRGGILKNRYGEFDLSKARAHKPVKKARAIVSVAFPSADFEVVAQAAEKAGVSLSAYIRQAAVNQMKPHVAQIQWTGTTYTSTGHCDCHTVTVYPLQYTRPA